MSFHKFQHSNHKLQSTIWGKCIFLSSIRQLNPHAPTKAGLKFPAIALQQYEGGGYDHIDKAKRN